MLPRLRNVNHKTAEGSPSDDDSYLGYSVATGEFDGDPSSPDVAVGMPRGSGLEGKVRPYIESMCISKQGLAISMNKILLI